MKHPDEGHCIFPGECADPERSGCNGCDYLAPAPKEDDDKCPVPECGGELETHLRRDGLITRCNSCGYVTD